jgi:hypothetical protein
MLLAFRQDDENVPVRSFSRLSSGSRAEKKYKAPLWRSASGHFFNLAEYVSVLIRHRKTLIIACKYTEKICKFQIN